MAIDSSILYEIAVDRFFRRKCSCSLLVRDSLLIERWFVQSMFYSAIYVHPFDVSCEYWRLWRQCPNNICCHLPLDLFSGRGTWHWIGQLAHETCFLDGFDTSNNVGLPVLFFIDAPWSIPFSCSVLAFNSGNLPWRSKLQPPVCAIRGCDASIDFSPKGAVLQTSLENHMGGFPTSFWIFSR